MKNWFSFQTATETTLFLIFSSSIAFKWDKWGKKTAKLCVWKEYKKKIQNNNTKNKLRKRPQTEMKSKLELTKINEERRNYAWIRVHVFHCVVCHICVCVCCRRPFISTSQNVHDGCDFTCVVRTWLSFLFIKIKAKGNGPETYSVSIVKTWLVCSCRCLHFTVG